MVARQITFTASETVQEIIKEANIPDKKQSNWINDKIVTAVMKSKQKESKDEDISELQDVEVHV